MTTKKKSFQSELFNFSLFYKYQDAIDFLANGLAAQEEWNFKDEKVKANGILKNYLEFTYRRLKQEGKIAFSSNSEFACFNTGLVTENQEDIFAYFQKSITKQNGTPQNPYFFRAFLKKSDHQILRNFSGNIPPVADYFHKPELLIFNPNYELITNIDHIIVDNIERFPQHLRTADQAELRRQLLGAIEEVKKRVRTNYKIAVPQFYDTKIQLLLPLSLTSGSPNPDLALVVYKIDDKTYSARTCLTLKMAYNNARLIVKPQSSWLNP